MKVILLDNVAKVGKKYDIVDVAPGYARNFLFARGHGEAITKSSAKRVAELSRKRELEKTHQDGLLEKAFAGLKNAVITLKRSANEEGHLYAGISKEELAEELGKAVGASFTGEHVTLEKSIKMVGEFTVPVLLSGKEGAFKVVVEAEK